MGKSQTKPTVVAVDRYIANFPDAVQVQLETIRVAIAKAAPDAVETIKYGLPTFVLGESLVHFGGFSKHIGFYPTPSAIEAFEHELTKYSSSKGAVKFPMDQPLPLPLIAKIVKFRVREARQKSKTVAPRT